MLNFFGRRKRHPRALPVVSGAARAEPHAVATPVGPVSCTLATCRAGSWATVLEMRCGDQDACRLRALGLCEGVRVNVVDARRAMLLEVRGTRIAIGPALTAGITVQPIAS